MTYSDEEMEQFNSEAEEWRIVRFYGDVKDFEGDYTELFRTVKIGRNNILPLSSGEYLIKDGKLCGVRVLCGEFSIHGGAGGYKGYSASLRFDEYEKIVKSAGIIFIRKLPEVHTPAIIQLFYPCQLLSLYTT